MSLQRTSCPDFVLSSSVALCSALGQCRFASFEVNEHNERASDEAISAPKKGKGYMR